MEDLKKEWEEEFNKNMPKFEGDEQKFGYKWLDENCHQVHTVTDWGNIKNYIHQNFIPKSKVEKVAGEIEKEVNWSTKMSEDEKDDLAYNRAVEDYKNKLLG